MLINPRGQADNGLSSFWDDPDHRVIAPCHPNILRKYTCYNCHEHNQAEINEEHSNEGMGNISDCTRCHPNGRKEEGGDD